MRHAIRLMAVACCAFHFLQPGPARAEKRLALSIGIDVYDNLPADAQLRKAVNDARAIGAALRELGFETTVEENVGRLAFTRAWTQFVNRLQPGERDRELAEKEKERAEAAEDERLFPAIPGMVRKTE